LLLCFEAPARGGQTLFVDMRRALLSLQEADRIAITGRFGIYPCREIYLRELEAMGLEDHERVLRLKELRHPLVRRHPETGEPALYLNEKWLTSIDGVPIEQGSALLGRLYNTATGASVTYAHNWNVGDLLIWDNASTMHKALPTEQGAKTTHRITIAGIPGPFTEV
jgi:taurine dioxygenase